jgi:broad specificity phosphatase PhoE
MRGIWFVRHGATDWNRDHRLQGQTDIALSAEGLAQAETLALTLAQCPVAAIACSDLRRAVQTAQPIARLHGIDPFLTTDLREVCLGDWEGLTPDDIRARWGEAVLSAYQGDPTTNPPPGAEERSAVEQRVSRAIATVLDELAEGVHLVVGHGGTLRTAICCAIGAPPELARRMWLDNASITRVDFGGRLPRLVSLNDTSHLVTKH